MNRLACSMLVLMGCASIPSEEEMMLPEGPQTARAEPVVPDAVVADREAPTPDPVVEKVEPLPECSWSEADAQRPPQLAAPPEGAACRPAPGRERMAELSRRAKERWSYAWPERETLVVEAGCDRLGRTLDTVVFELSSGHGGSLQLAELRHRADGDWQMTFIDYNHYYGGSPREGAPGDPWIADSTGAVALYEGVVPAATVDPVLLRARQALALQLHEPEPPQSDLGLASYGFSSRDFHVALQLVDDAGHGIERYFAGYESGGDEQATQVTLDLASDELWTLVEEPVVTTLDLRTAEDPDLRRLFSERLWAATERDAEWGYWYVQERMLGLAAPLGHPSHVAALLPVVAREGEDWEDRRRVLAVNAIAAITGFDTRYDDEGDFRTLAVVAPEVLRACNR